MSAATVHAAHHLGHAFRTRTAAPHVLSTVSKLGRTISHSFVRPEDYTHNAKVLLGEAHEPYPTSQLDTSLFEADSAEYASFTMLTQPTKVDNTSAMNAVLRLHIRHQEIDRALTLMDELEMVGVPIHNDPNFKLIEQGDWMPRDVRAFLRLWKHVPDMGTERIDRRETAERFTNILRLLLMRQTDLYPLANFAVLAASKGYAVLAGERVISHLVRYGTPAYAEGTIHELLKKVKLHPATADKYEWLREWWYNIAIRGHARNAQVDYSVKLLRKTRHEKRVPIQAGTYKLLMHTLVHSDKQGQYEYIRQWALQDYPHYTWLLMTDTDKPDPQGLAPDERLSHKILLGNTDSEAAAALRSVLATPPHVSIARIADFIEDCISFDRRAVIDKVDQWANASHEGAVSGRAEYWTGRWTVGIMLFFYQREQYSEVLHNYAHRFQSHNVPLLPLLPHDVGGETGAPLKLWPSPFAQAIAIQARLRSIPLHSENAIQRQGALYDTFIDTVRAAVAAARTVVPSKPSPLDPPPEDNAAPLSTGEDDDAFSGAVSHALPTYMVWKTFIEWAFKEDYLWGRALLARILSDMRDLSIYPNVLIWNKIFGRLLVQKHFTLLFHFLDLMEGNKQPVVPRDWPSEFFVLRAFEDNLPRPNVIMYGTLLHMCMRQAINRKSKRIAFLEAADLLRRRMIRHGWEHGNLTRQMFIDLDALMLKSRNNEEMDHTLIPDYSKLKRDKMKYDHDPNFAPWTGKFGVPAPEPHAADGCNMPVREGNKARWEQMGWL